MSRTVQVPYELFEDEDGVWCANAFFQHGGAHGYGNTRDEALEDLREAIVAAIEAGQDLTPAMLTVTVDDAA